MKDTATVTCNCNEIGEINNFYGDDFIDLELHCELDSF